MQQKIIFEYVYLKFLTFNPVFDLVFYILCFHKKVQIFIFQFYIYLTYSYFYDAIQSHKN